MTENPKYRLTDETIVFDDKTLYRIEAVRDFGNVASGMLGGFVETEDNLSHDGNCWIVGKAKVFGGALVSGNAFVNMDSVVRDRAMVSGDAHIFDSVIKDCAEVTGASRVYGSSVYDCAFVDTTGVLRRATVGGFSRIYDNASIMAGSLIDHASLAGDAQVVQDAVVSGSATIRDIRVGSCVSQDPVLIKGFRYSVVVTDTHVSIGCQSHPFKVWTKGMFMPLNKGYRILRAHNVRHKDAVRMIRALKEIIALHGAKVRRGLAGKNCDDL